MDSVNKTLYIPLYGKAYVSQRGLFLRDKTAETIWENEGFALKRKAKSKWLAYNMGMRAAVFDRWLTEELTENPDTPVLHLGCGLDGRVSRVEHGGHLWFDIDFPEVIAERRRYFSETENDRMLAADVRQKGWLEAVPRAEKAIVVMEGLSMYLQREELQDVLRMLGDRFGNVHLLMDTYTTFAAKATKFKNPIRSVGVTEVYGVDTPEEVTGDTDFRFHREYALTPDSLISQLPKREQGFFRILFAGKPAKKIYRLYACRKETK